MPRKQRPSGSKSHKAASKHRKAKPTAKSAGTSRNGIRIRTSARAIRTDTNAGTEVQSQDQSDPAVVPQVVTMTGDEFEAAYTELFKDEVQPASEPTTFLRIGNHFSIVERGTLNMVEWDGKKKLAHEIDMIAFVAPLSGGYTPLYLGESHPSVWELTGFFARVEVKGPLVRDQQVVGDHSVDGVWIQGGDDKAFYLLQHPDPQYKAIYERTVESWNRRIKTPGKQLIRFESVDLEKPCPFWMPLWVMRMLRLEAKKPKDVEGDLDAEGSVTPPTPGRSISPAQDDESATDAGSIIDIQNELNVPDCTSYSWHTRTSRPWDTFSETFGPEASAQYEAATSLLAGQYVPTPQLTPEPSEGHSGVLTPRFRTQSPPAPNQG
ncbi:hypothetical protein FRC11_008152 [Ceratobasidium sp. 423]|nr:hypothetical protein FRC11_008152 [Ceratobasidium sp. 423]